MKNLSPYEFEIFLPGNPIQWRRPGKNGIISYDTQRKEKLFYGLTFRKYWKREPLTGPVQVSFEFRIKPSRVLEKKFGGKIEGEHHLRTPDLDNYCKFLLDSLKGVAWEDDDLIVMLDARKYWSYSPGTFIIIKELIPDTQTGKSDDDLDT